MMSPSIYHWLILTLIVITSFLSEVVISFTFSVPCSSSSVGSNSRVSLASSSNCNTIRRSSKIRFGGSNSFYASPSTFMNINNNQIEMKNYLQQHSSLYSTISDDSASPPLPPPHKKKSPKPKKPKKLRTTNEEETFLTNDEDGLISKSYIYGNDTTTTNSSDTPVDYIFPEEFLNATAGYPGKRYLVYFEDNWFSNPLDDNSNDIISDDLLPEPTRSNIRDAEALGFNSNSQPCPIFTKRVHAMKGSVLHMRRYTRDLKSGINVLGCYNLLDPLCISRETGTILHVEVCLNRRADGLEFGKCEAERRSIRDFEDMKINDERYINGETLLDTELKLLHSFLDRDPLPLSLGFGSSSSTSETVPSHERMKIFQWNPNREDPYLRFDIGRGYKGLRGTGGLSDNVAFAMNNGRVGLTGRLEGEMDRLDMVNDEDENDDEDDEGDPIDNNEDLIIDEDSDDDDGNLLDKENIPEEEKCYYYPSLILCIDKAEAPRDLRPNTREEHLAYLRKSRRISGAGPIFTTEDGTTPIGSFLLLNSKDAAHARAFAKGDPYNSVDLFSKTMARRYNLIDITGKHQANDYKVVDNNAKKNDKGEDLYRANAFSGTFPGFEGTSGGGDSNASKRQGDTSVNAEVKRNLGFTDRHSSIIGFRDNEVVDRSRIRGEELEEAGDDENAVDASSQHRKGKTTMINKIVENFEERAAPLRGIGRELYETDADQGIKRGGMDDVENIIQSEGEDFKEDLTPWAK